jgi:hypothetical protein
MSSLNRPALELLALLDESEGRAREDQFRLRQDCLDRLYSKVTRIE